MAPKKQKGKAPAPEPAHEAPAEAPPAVADPPAQEAAGNEQEDATQVQPVAPAQEAEKEQEAPTEQPPQQLKPWKNPVSAVSDRLKSAGIADPWEEVACNPSDFQLVFGALTPTMRAGMLATSRAAKRAYRKCAELCQPPCATVSSSPFAAFESLYALTRTPCNPRRGYP